MTDVDETTPRRRGRPRKDAENHQNEVNTAVLDTELDELDPAAEYAAMQNQIKYQLKALMQIAAKAGVDPFEGFDIPPREDTVVVDDSPPPPRRSGRPRPGSLLGDPGDPNVAYVPWRKEDLDSGDTITFVPQPIPSLVYPLTDEDGRQKILLDVNDLKCFLTVGVSNTVNKFFHNAYMNAYDSWKDLENFKRRGPQYAPWGMVGPDGRPSWHYDPSAFSFGMDIDGKFLVPGRNAIQEVHADNPEAI